ncbi:TetR/AcrR family transcriptional regulator [uncultured Microscilla sp.]|uniref:TetR/AcrR family transcriptional regulator n=1 Tax=uncultured Microscilla sp. TaxID=432653 RepID=UPI0026054B6A|nr:TetR/AcrR family transcriptional regulator [uncultured Microscilla sp.]
MGTPKDIRKKQRYEAIVDAAEKVFFSKGIDNASMDQVAKQAGLGKGTLYLYFESKNALYRAILYRAFATLKKQFEEALDEENTGFENMKTILRVYLDFFYNHPHYFNAILHFQNDLFNLDAMASEQQIYLAEGVAIIELGAQLIEKGQQDGSIRNDLKAIEAAYVFWGQTMGVLQLVQKKMAIVTHYHQLEADQLIVQHFKLIEYVLKGS